MTSLLSRSHTLRRSFARLLNVKYSDDLATWNALRTRSVSTTVVDRVLDLAAPAEGTRYYCAVAQ